MINKSSQKILFLFCVLFLLLFTKQTFGQSDVFQLMERTDLSIDEVKEWAEDYFKNVDRVKNSEYKQYQRWLYERKFHLDENGYFIKPELEDQSYHKALRSMGLKTRASMVWSELGPRSWSYTSGWNPGVGRLTSVAIHRGDTTIIYVSSPGGGIWKSTNSGTTWTPLIDFVNSAWMNVFHLCIDPSNSNTVYASLSSGGVLKSTNAGVTWSTTGSGPSGTKQVKVHPSNSSIVFAAASNGIWRSTNGGAAWTQAVTLSMEDIEFNPSNPNTMYASGSNSTNSILRSTNNGSSWTALSSGNGITNTGRTLIAVSQHNPAVVYALQASGSLFGRLYKSTDSGASYTTMIVGNPASGTNFFGYEPNGTGTSGQATYDMAIAVNPLDVNEVHIAGIICWKSVNGGSSFTATTVWSYPNSTGYNHADVHSLEWIKKTLYSTSDGGIYKSMNNAGDWTDLSSGLGIRQFYRIACSKTDPNVITTGAQDNGSTFRRTNGSWVDWLGADGMDNIISPTNANIAIGTSQYGSIYKTTDAGSTRTNLTTPVSGNWVTPLVMHPTSHDTVYGGWQGVYRSSNGGSSFTKISGSISSYMDALAIAPSNTKYIYASSSNTLYRTTDGGATWTTLSTSSPITSIFVSKVNPSKIWITCNNTTNSVFVSTNGGSTFTDISSGLPNLSARSVVVDEDAVETIYIGMNIGVYYRDNLTNTWAAQGTGLPLVAVNEVEIQKSSKKLRVATYGRGIWESDLQNTSIPCSDPSSLTATNITSSSATLNWSASSGAVSYRVEYKLTSASTWTTLSSAHTSTSIALTGLASSSSFIWRVQSNCSASTSNYAQSSFSTISSCPNITGLQTLSTTSSQANLKWNAISGASSYNVEYKLTSASTWIVSSATSTNTKTLSSLSPGSYEWRVKALCGSSSSNFSTSTFKIYCASAGTGSSQGYIDYIALGSINRTSGSDGGYYNGTSLSTNIKPGTTYSIKVSPNYSGSNVTTYWRVYIDYNLDGDFTDANEQAAQATYAAKANKTINFTVPANATIGLSRIRVSLARGNYQGSCASFTNGEVEDYTVNITNTPDTAPMTPSLEPMITDQEPVIDNSNDIVPFRLNVYPNPAKDELQLSYFLDEEDDKIELQIYDLQGRSVLGSTVKGLKDKNSSTIDISTLGNGQYMIQMLSRTMVERSNFVIQK